MDIVQDYVHQLRFAPCLREIKELYKKHCEYVDVITSNVFMWAEWAQCYEGDYIDEMYLENHIKEILRQDWFRNGRVLRSRDTHHLSDLPSHLRAEIDCYTHSAVEHLLYNCHQSVWIPFPFQEMGQGPIQCFLQERLYNALQILGTKYDWFPYPLEKDFPQFTFWMLETQEEMFRARDNYNPATKKFTAEWLNSMRSHKLFRVFHKWYDCKQPRITQLKKWKLRWKGYNCRCHYSSDDDSTDVEQDPN